jgi:hypothetical protein
MLITSPSDNDNFSADSLENVNEDEAKKKKKKSKKLLPKLRRKTYLELYQSRLAVEFLNHRKSVVENEVQKVVVVDECGNDDGKQREVKMREKKRSCRWSEYLARQQQCALSQTNSKSEMLKRRTEYGCRMSSMNRLNRLCKDLHELSNDDNGSNKNASTSKKAQVNEKQRKISKDGKCEMKAREEALQMRLQQMQIRHRIDKRKAERIQNSLMLENGLKDFLGELKLS